MTGHPRILVADDDADLRMAATSALEADGAEVVAVASGAELVQQLAEEAPFDLLVTDVAMPWMSGLQVTLSARRAGLSLPVIVMTALRDADLPARVAALGGPVQLLRKPFSLAELQATVASMLGRA
jgi:CheY-like chemotaxis protein